MYILNKIDALEWIRKTIEKMENHETEDRLEWNRFWEETYFELGGKSYSVAHKGCPKKAGYTLWYLGRIKGSNRERVEMPIDEVTNRCSKNGAYAILGQEILSKSSNLNKTDLFRMIQDEYRIRTKDDPAKSDQGGPTLTWILFKAEMLK
ncbi:hypothetical protein C5S30_01400 [ANME-1 cluster archaeon GoMg4]|nr:hypothetical protein [ANME-1 cluster archaeon GoMg4]